MTRSVPMTTVRRLALITGVPLVLIIIGWAGLTEVAFAGLGSYQVRLSAPVHGSTVSLSAGAADVRVTQDAGSTLRLAGRAHYSLVRSDVTWHTTPSGVIVSPRCHLFLGICSFSFRVAVPAGKRAHISAGSGNISGAGLSGDLKLSTGSGNIGFTGLAGAEVTVSAGSGDVALTFSRIPAHVTVNSGSGNVTLVLPAAPTRYHVSVSTQSGSTAIAVPTSRSSQHTINVETGSGNVSVTN